MDVSRRQFIKVSGAAGTGLVLMGLAACSQWQGEIVDTAPVDGDMLTEYEGVITENGLRSEIKIIAPPGAHIKVNGVKAKYMGNCYLTEVLLKDYKNEIEITERSSRSKKIITLYWLKNYTNKYRLSLDDNIWFLKDISDNSLKYGSIFENPYLGFLKEIHDTFGTRIHINIYYQTSGFNLSMMTDRYKNEWIGNSDWLRLSFHALGNDPDKPYIRSGYEEVKKDCEMVKEQIRRFAGEELLGPVTTLHWGEATVEGCRALKDSGYNALLGYFNIENGSPVVSYYLDDKQTQHLDDRFIWRDNKEGIIYKKIGIVLNSHELGQIVPLLDELKKNPRKSEFVDLMIHEQYFYPNYVDYQSDFRQKVLAGVNWAYNNGYKPAFLSDCIFS
jgi:hypothetical protein